MKAASALNTSLPHPLSHYQLFGLDKIGYLSHLLIRTCLNISFFPFGFISLLLYHHLLSLLKAVCSLWNSYRATLPPTFSKQMFFILTILLSITPSSTSSFYDGGICLLGKGLRPSLYLKLHKRMNKCKHDGT